MPKKGGLLLRCPRVGIYRDQSFRFGSLCSGFLLQMHTFVISAQIVPFFASLWGAPWRPGQVKKNWETMPSLVGIRTSTPLP